MTAALLVIDPQLDFLPMVESGSVDTCSAEQALAGMARLLEAARARAMPVIFTCEVHRPEQVDFGRELDGDEPIHCVENTPGAELADGLGPRAGEWTIHKRRYSAFFATDLDLLLRGLCVDTIIACGLLTDVCVHYTCVDAHQLDYRVRVARDACGGSSPPAARAALQAIDYLQSGAVASAEELIPFLPRSLETRAGERHLEEVDRHRKSAVHTSKGIPILT